jgi:hypothetical protein
MTIYPLSQPEEYFVPVDQILYPPGKISDQLHVWGTLSQQIGVSAMLFSDEESTIEPQFNTWLAKNRPLLDKVERVTFQYLTSLPPQIGKLSHLQELHIESSCLTEIPAEIKELVNLREFSWSGLQSTTVPKVLATLPCNCKLTISGPDVSIRDVYAFYLQIAQERAQNPARGPDIANIHPFEFTTTSISFVDICSDLKKLVWREKFIRPESYWYADLTQFDYVVPEIMDLNGVSILTGDLKKVAATELTEEAKANIIVAKKIQAFVREAVPFSGNYPRKSEIYQYVQSNDEAEAIADTISQCTVAVQSLKTLGLKHYIDAIMFFQAGNCQEKTLIGFQEGATLPSAPRIEMFHIVNGHHVFLIIGRKEGSLPHDFENFGESCMVCDTWSGAYFPASLIKTYLFDWKETQCWDQRVLTQVAPFDPSYQQLEVYTL